MWSAHTTVHFDCCHYSCAFSIAMNLLTSCECTVLPVIVSQLRISSKLNFNVSKLPQMRYAVVTAWLCLSLQRAVVEYGF